MNDIDLLKVDKNEQKGKIKNLEEKNKGFRA